MDNRKIKFRAWHLKEERMYMVTTLDWIWNGEQIFDIAVQFKKDMPTRTRTSQANAFKLMQFTGLIDKNGKDIYEGDVINFVDSAGGKHKNFDVEFRNGVFVPFHALEISKDGQVYVEVIGNIYENPELLKV